MDLVVPADGTIRASHHLSHDPQSLYLVPQVDEDETPSITEPSTEAGVPSEEPLLGELTVTGSSPDSLRLSWTVPEGQFDHFLVQYKNGDGQPKAVRVPGHEDMVTISGLEPDHKYKMNPVSYTHLTLPTTT